MKVLFENISNCKKNFYSTIYHKAFEVGNMTSYKTSRHKHPRPSRRYVCHAFTYEYQRCRSIKLKKYLITKIFAKPK